jgi:DNA repair protein RadC
MTCSQGSLNESLAYLREIFKPVILYSAYRFILVHNHSSGAMPYLSLSLARAT